MDLDHLQEAANRVCENRVGMDLRCSWYEHDHKYVKYTKFVKRDKKRMDSIIFENGKLPVIEDWARVEREFTLFAQRHAHTTVRAKFVHIPSDDNFHLKLSDDDWTKDYNFCVIHDDNIVYLAVPSPEMANLLYNAALKKLNLEIKITEYEEDLMKDYGKKNPKLQFPPFSMNFGITARPQPSSLVVKRVVKTTSIPSVVFPKYNSGFIGVYAKRSTSRKDRYHNNRRGCARLRQNFRSSFHEIPKTLLDTYVSKDKKVKDGLRRLGILENKMRSVDEYLMANFFLPLPYGSLPFISMENMANSRSLMKNDGQKDDFPIPRCFPKGTVGMYATKSLHDDDNGALTPSFWSSVVGDSNVVLTFHGMKFEISITASTGRFCWFMGWIPHKSSLISEEIPPKKNRINHSSYCKPEYEQLSLAVLHKKHFCDVIKTVKYKN